MDGQITATPTPGSANQTTLATERSPVAGFSLPAGRLADTSIDFVQGNLMSDPGYNYTAIRGSMKEFTDLIAFVTSNSLAGSANHN